MANVKGIKYLRNMRIFKSYSMTKLSLALAFGMLVGLTSCYEESNLGDITTQERELDEFYGLDLDGIGNAELIISSELIRWWSKSKIKEFV